ncbi:MAG: NUDIX hydrolase [Candidatus Sericytochromatia bacterium]|nr:NUDIX hydrolase [Candidatus Sericytochromatia bacterium]
MSDARPPRESATVLLLRDGAAGLEVFMVRRHLASDFVGGAYVFPGGAVDPEDESPELVCRLGADDAASWGERLRLAPARAAAHVVAALRETFEEAGVLLARTSAGTRVSTGGDDRARWEDLRASLLAGRLSWQALVAAEGLTFTTEQVAYFAHWITPLGTPKRFSTRFFLAEAPPDQEPLADNREVEAGVWLRPEEALEARRTGRMTVILPTARSLEALLPCRTAAEAMAQARGRRVEPILPRIVMRDGEPVALLPGDPGYDEAAEAPLPAFDPSRM